MCPRLSRIHHHHQLQLVTIEQLITAESIKRTTIHSTNKRVDAFEICPWKIGEVRLVQQKYSCFGELVQYLFHSLLLLPISHSLQRAEIILLD